MAIYSKGKGKWRVRIWFKGKRRDWIVEGLKTDAQAFEARQRSELLAGEAAPAPRTVPNFCDFSVEVYRVHAELHLKASTWEKQRYLVINLAEFFGKRRLGEIDATLVDAYVRQRLADGLKPVSVNNELRVLQRILNFARKERGLNLPVPKIRFLRETGTRRVKAWTRAEIERLIEVCGVDCPELLPLVVFLANTGARKGEALALTWDHVDLEGRLIRIWPSEEWQPKSGKPREVPISDALLPWLTGERRSKKWVFPSSTGERYAFWPKNQFNRVARSAGLSGGPHTLRHSYATHFLAHCPDIYLLARVLGHSDVTVTRLYAHLLPDHLAKARNVVGFV